MAKILICDDEAGLRAVLKRYANFEGHKTVEAGTGPEALEAFKKEEFDIVLMDIMMPDMDGFSAVKEIRKSSNVPVIMISARGEEYDKVLGFELGIDDYVVKPFSSKEIMLRISAILRRTGKVLIKDDHVVFTKDGFTADMSAFRVIIDGRQIELAPKLYDLLFFFIRNNNIAIPREKILSDVWGYEYFGDDRTLDTHIKLLRKAITPYDDLIKTLRGHGYRFEG
ncbi:MAG: response regulator transcription factor [Treponema sp.]|nr:response regulator transcription factor [Treponema sp.]